MSDFWQIRPVQPADNAALAQLIQDVLVEFGCVGPGFASSDPELQDLYQAYSPPDPQAPDRAYWVVENRQTEQVAGGGGFSSLKSCSSRSNHKIAELQKLYFAPQARGYGLGKTLIQHCIIQAKRFGYASLYLETVPQMSGAIHLYERFGFHRINTAMGSTGHTSCTVFMLKHLDKPLL